MQSYTEKKQVGQIAIQSVQFEEKGNTRRCNGAKSCARGDKKFKEEPDAK